MVGVLCMEVEAYKALWISLDVLGNMSFSLLHFLELKNNFYYGREECKS